MLFLRPVLFFIIGLFYISVPSYGETPLFDDAMSLAPGHWGVERATIIDGKPQDTRRCGASPVVISIDRKNMRYRADHTGEDFVAEADILKVTPRYLSLRYDDETRVMKNGQPHIWHMVFVEDNKFYWVLGRGVSGGEREGVVKKARHRCMPALS